MFSLEDKEDITFSVNPRVKENFDLALSLLNMDKEEAFEEFTSALIAQALRKGDSMKKIVISGKEDKLSDDVVKGRIRKWFNNKDGQPYKMLKAFLIVSHNMNDKIEEPVDRFKMSGYFKSFLNCDENKFDSIFRQMCSNSKRAYGDVFIYNRPTRTVSLNKKYIDLIQELVNDDDWIE